MELNSPAPQGRLLFGIMASLAEFERSLIAERVRAGMERARAQGRHTGRPRLSEAKRAEILDLLREGRLSRRAIGKRLGVSHEIVRLIGKANV
jgi:DNA invertase Pin-like site-specific DNA recombinase